MAVAGEASPIDQLYGAAGRAYANGQWQQAYDLYEQLRRRRDELSEDRLETVKSRLTEVQQKLTAQAKVERRRKAADSYLREIGEKLEKGEPLQAYRQVQMLEAAGLGKYMKWEQKRELDQLRQRLRVDLQGTGDSRLQQLAQLCQQEEYEKARAEVHTLTQIEDYLTTAQKAKLQQLRVSVFKATGIKELLPPESRVQLAEMWFEKGIEAYDNYNYAEAQQQLTWAKRTEVDLGWWDNWTLDDALEEVNYTVDRLKKHFSQGQRDYNLGQLDEAEEHFLAVTESNVKFNPEIRSKAEEYLERIFRGVPAGEGETVAVAEKPVEKPVEPGESVEQKPAEPERAAEQKPAEKVTLPEAPTTPAEGVSEVDVEDVEQLQKTAEELAEQRRQTVQEVNRYRQRAEKIRARVEKVNELWEAEKYSEAKTVLQEVRDALQQIDGPRGPQLEEDAQEIKQKLAAVDDKIEQKASEEKRREQARRTIDNLFAEAEGFYPGQLLKAEDKVIKARNLADRLGLSLTEEQKHLYGKITDAAVQAFGERQAGRRTYYSRLLSESQKYLRRGEPGHALEALKLAQKALSPVLAAEERARIEQMLQEVQQELQQQEDVLQRVSKLEDEATKLADQDKLGNADRKCSEALTIIEENGLPESVRARVLELRAQIISQWKSSASVKKALEDVWSYVDEKARSLTEQEPLYKAKYYVREGSYDLAKEHLTQVADNPSRFGKQSAQWAAKQLEGIDERIAQRDRWEKAVVKDKLAAVVEAEQRFQRVADRVRGPQLQQALRDVADARLELQMAKIESYLERGAYPLAAKAVEGVPVEEASEVLARRFWRLQQRVLAWKTAGQLVDRIRQALLDHRSDAAKGDLEKMASLGAVGPWGEMQDELQQAVAKAQQAQQTRHEVLMSKIDLLAEVRKKLAGARARENAYAQYARAREAFVSARWGQAASLLNKLDESPEGLYAFERQNVNTMLADAGEMMDAVTEARHVLAAAESAFRQGDNLRAAEALNRLRETRGYALDEGLVEKAGALTEKICRAEPGAIADARQALSEADTAFQSRDYEEASQLVAELRGMPGVKFDPELASRLEELSSKLAGKMKAEVTGAEQVLAGAEKAYQQGKIAEAWTALERLRDMRGYALDNEVAQRADALHEKVWQARQKEIDEARKALAAAREAYNAARYQQADELLAMVRQMDGYRLAEDVEPEAEKLARKVAQKEKEAEELYREAVRAYEADDLDELGRLLGQLRKEYRHTEVYQTRSM